MLDRSLILIISKNRDIFRGFFVVLIVAGGSYISFPLLHMSMEGGFQLLYRILKYEKIARYTNYGVSGFLQIIYFTNTCLHVLAFVRIS